MTAERLVFAGTPEFAAIHLQGLLAAGRVPVAVYTQPDRPAGRGKKLTASPVKALAEAHGIPVLQPTSLRSTEAEAELAALAPDLLIVVAYGLILPRAILDVPTHGCINVHASMLPRRRGGAPIQRAIEAGDSQTGTTIMQMEAGLDTGPMLDTASIDIDSDMTAAVLHDALAERGVPLLISVLDNLADCLASAEQQDDARATYAAKIEKAEAKVDWCLSAEVLDRRIRAFNPFPVCWTLLGDQRIKVWAAVPVTTDTTAAPGTILEASEQGLLVACGEGALRLTRLQLPGGKPLAVSELLRARRDMLAAGERFGPELGS
ncbi:MAG: methionyl-tRNA formyltransferase [Halieaceae bacterium]|nr:methionyl-tRNA formyltransferase [Halieaceae bacterium]